jgi:hypothetical protein
MLGRQLVKSRPQITYEATLADLKAVGVLPKKAAAAGSVALTDYAGFNA